MTVFISGISRGLGLGLARRYLADEHTVVGSVREENDAVGELRAAYGESLGVVHFDVTDRASVDAAARSMDARAIDILICNAGANPYGPGERRSLAETGDEELLETFDVNVAGPLRLVRAFQPHLMAGSTRKIAVISSGAGSLELTSSGTMIGYCVSKAALNMLARRLHYLLADDGCSVLIVHPGWVRTDMGTSAAPVTIEDSAAGIVGVIESFAPGSPQFQDYRGKAMPW